MEDEEIIPEQNDSKSPLKKYVWVAIGYLFFEVFGFFYALSFAHWRGGTKEVEIYTMIRIMLFFTALGIYIVGREKNSRSLKRQGGCFLTGNIILVILLTYLFSL